jgi:hypothetical protein
MIVIVVVIAVCLLLLPEELLSLGCQLLPVKEDLYVDVYISLIIEWFLSNRKYIVLS